MRAKGSEELDCFAAVGVRRGQPAPAFLKSLRNEMAKI